MELELPKYLKIGWSIYTVEAWDGKAASRARCFGECDTVLKIIRVDNSGCPRQAAQSLLHEIMHAIAAVWKTPESDAEETFVGAFASGLSTVITDNPQLLPCLAAALGWTAP